ELLERDDEAKVDEICSKLAFHASTLAAKIEPNGPNRPRVFEAIVKLAGASDELDLVVPTLSQLEPMMKSWGLTTPQKQRIYLLLSENLVKSTEHENLAFQFGLRYLASVSPADAESPAVREVAISIIKTAIKLPSVLNFEDLFRLAPVQSIKKVDPKLFELLNIFVDKTYSQYRAFVDKNPLFLRDSKLANDEAEMDAISIKIRLLTLATLASQFVDGEMPYSAVAESLNIPETDVEMWIIDVMLSAVGLRPLLAVATRTATPPSYIASTAVVLYQQSRNATKKSGGSSSNGRTSNPKFLGVKLGGGTRVDHPGQIVVRQRGTKWHAGPGVAVGRDHTLYATRPGWVTFTYDLARQRRVIWIAERREDVENSQRSDGELAGDPIGFGSRSHVREQIAAAIDGKRYMGLDGLGRWKYVMAVADRLAKEDEVRRTKALSKRLEGQTRGAFDLVDLTLV
ncbi:hypothetical protein HK405_007584, partial [Cladochytrium tenue]